MDDVYPQRSSQLWLSNIDTTKTYTAYKQIVSVELDTINNTIIVTYYNKYKEIDNSCIIATYYVDIYSVNDKGKIIRKTEEFGRIK
jgi:hypothetical protein